jgi:2-polyprenyl-6-methoxyphenol hydroxylase-like FAD-dependent oxidoreductase
MDKTNNILRTECCIAGGGPAGVMLGYLLSRSGINVVVLEKWPDFFRDFRGDTIHPSTMEIMRELDLLSEFLKLPHNETRQVAARIAGENLVIADFTKIKSATPFLGFMPQWDFLNFISSQAAKSKNFHLLMETEALDVIEENSRIVGINAKDKNQEFQILADLVVAADGRHSTIRQAAGMKPEELGAPIDVLWFRLPRKENHQAQSLGYIGHKHMMVLIDRDSYWQCAFIIPKDGFDRVKSAGLEALRTSIARTAPILTESVNELTSWDQVKFLSVAVDRLEQWHKPGLLCIGDAAHAMSPVGGVGINLAVADAVAAANILIPAFKRKGGITADDLAAIQKRRLLPAKIIQRVQLYIHKHVLEPALETESISIPWQIKLLQKFPYLQRLPAYLIGIGIRAEHVRQ